MKNLIAGYFNNSENHKNLETSFIDSGLADEDFTIYINNTDEVFLASVKIENDAEKIAAHEIFRSHNAINSYDFEDVPEKHTYQNLKELIQKVAYSEITEAQNLLIKKSSDGMNDEIIFGK
jgi:hypothetical protein